MKRISLLLTITFLATGVFAQEDFEKEQEKEQEMQTIFNKQMSFGGYGGPELKLTTFKEKYGLMVGGHGGFIMNHNFIIGGGGYGLTTNSRFNEDTMNLQTGYGGLRLEYVCCSHKLVHFSVPVLIGAGGVRITSETDDADYVSVNYDTNDDDEIDIWEWKEVETGAYFVLEPGVNVELNVVKHFRIAMGGSYRYVAGSNLEDVSDKELSDFAFNLSFKFGVF